MSEANRTDKSAQFQALKKCLSNVPPTQVEEPTICHFPLVISSPHSGRYYPKYFVEGSRLEPQLLRASEDYYVDRLVSGAQELGIVLLKAIYPRAFIDLNREPYELDQRMFNDKLPGHINTSSLRVGAGLGTIARIVTENKDIYKNKLHLDEAMARIEHIYRPYHQALGHQLARTHVEFGSAILIDCHSMPSGKQAVGSSKPLQASKTRADFIIGDRYGSSCAKWISDFTMDYLNKHGFTVVRNKPYAGGFISEHYGRPSKHLHAIQIEINRALYVNEMTLEPLENFAKIQQVMTNLFAQIGKIALSASRVSGENDLAAE